MRLLKRNSVHFQIRSAERRIMKLQTVNVVERFVQEPPAAGGTAMAVAAPAFALGGMTYQLGIQPAATSSVAEPLSNDALLKRFAFAGMGLTSASGIVMAGEKFNGLTDHQIWASLTSSSQISVTDVSQQPVFQAIKSLKDSLVGHYIFFCISGGVVTVFVLRAVNPEMPWRRAIGYGVAVMTGLLALLMGSHYFGWIK
jgi:hypothetical protein